MGAAFAELTGAPIEDGLDFGSVEWATNNVTLNLDNHPGPDDALRADSIREDATVAIHRLELVPARALVEGDAVTFGVYFRYLDRTRVAIGVDVTGGAVWCDVDLLLDKIAVAPVPLGEVSAVGAAFAIDRAGWRRVSLSVAVNAALSATFWIALLPDDGSLAAYAGNTSRIVRVWGAWLAAGQVRPHEAHETGWGGNEAASANIAATEDANFATGLADPAIRTQETHESGWDNAPLWTQTASAAAAAFDVAVPEAVEDHEEEWAVSQILAPNATSATPALFAGEPVETHEALWQSNESTSFLILDSVEAVFGGGLTVDDHEFVYADRQYTIDPITSTITCPAHGLIDESLYIYAQLGGFIPYAIGVNESVLLYVINVGVGGNTFQLSLTPSGTPIDFEDAGTGQQFFRLNPATHWSGDDVG